jgi:hypothetical protein
VARIACVVPDLMLASRVRELLGAAGHEVIAARPEEDERLRSVDLIVADVDEADPGSLAGHGAPVLGFHRHTDPESRARAEQAGVELVVPRSRMARELPQLVDQILG